MRITLARTCTQMSLSLLLSASAHSAPTPKIITVHEGTNLAVTVSPDRKTILMDLQGMIYSLPFPGGKATRITGPLVEASHPEYSPDGKTVVIQSYAGGTFHLWLMHPDGTALRQLTTGHGDDREPRFSPDGKALAFSSDRAYKGSYDIWTVDIATGALHQVTTSDNDEYEPAWSPDGLSIAYVNGSFTPGPPPHRRSPGPHHRSHRPCHQRNQSPRLN